MAFTQASNFRIDGSQFNNYNYTYHIDGSIPDDHRGPASVLAPIEALYRRAAISATHESALATYAPRCKVGTRLEIIADLVSWARNPPKTPDSKILWFSGPAGAGKTCIQREVSRQLQEGPKPGDKPILAASYFFSNRMEASSAAGQPQGSSAGPNLPSPTLLGVLSSVDPFIAIISYQLVTSIPGLIDHVEKAIREDPMVFDKGLDVQAKKLISEPLVLWKSMPSPPDPASGPSITPTAGPSKPTIDISPYTSPPRQLGRKSKRGDTPARAGNNSKPYMASRRGTRSNAAKIMEGKLPQETYGDKTYADTVTIDGWDEITDVAKREKLLDIIRDLATHPIAPLRFIIASRPEHDIRTRFGYPHYQSITRHLKLEDYNGDDDVRRFICDVFDRIRSSHTAKASIPYDWPPEEDINTIVDKSCGNFIYASVVVKFVDNPRKQPVDLLKQVLKKDVSSQRRTGVAQPLAELYNLYDIIFRPPDVEMALLKQVLHLIHATGKGSTPHDYNFFDQLLSVPNGTTSILLCDLHSLIDVNGDLHFHHKTAIDYLLDPFASGDLYQPLHETHAQLATYCITNLQNWFAQAEEVRLEEKSNVLSHAAYFWDHYTGRALQSRPISLLRGLATFDPRILWLALFLRGDHCELSQNLKDEMPFVHETMCTAEECKSFCQRMHHLIEVEDRAIAIVVDANKSEGCDFMSYLRRSRTHQYKDFMQLIEMD